MYCLQKSCSCHFLSTDKILGSICLSSNPVYLISLDHISSNCIALHILCSCAFTYDQRENLQIAVCTAVNADHIREAVKYYFALNSSHFTSLESTCYSSHLITSCLIALLCILYAAVRLHTIIDQRENLQIADCTAVNADHVTNLVAFQTKLEDSALRCFEMSALV